MKLANRKLDAFEPDSGFMGLRRLRNIVLFFFVVVLFCGCTTHKAGELMGSFFKVTPTSIRLIDKNYFWALKQHYIEGTGLDVFLTKEQFDNLMRYGKIDFSTVKLIDDDYFVANVSFYDSNLDLHLSFGTATVKFKMENDRIEFYAFSDTYNFDPKPWGARGTLNELLVRTYNKLSNGTQFGIYYNKTLF